MNRLRRAMAGWEALWVMILMGASACAPSGTTSADGVGKGAAANEALSPQMLRIADYRFGQNREPLTAFTDQAQAARSKAEESRKLERQLTALLDADKATSASKDFACRQLALIGTDESVPTLAALLKNQELAGMARYALENIPGEASLAALRSSLSQAQGLNKAGVINSLGVRRDRKSVPTLYRLVKDPDPRVAGAAAHALGRIGGAEAAWALAKVNRRGKISPELSLTIKDAYLLCADSLPAQGDKRKATAIYEELVTLAQPIQVRPAALRGLLATDQAKGMVVLSAALTGSDPRMQAAAMRFVRELPGEELTKTFAAQLAGIRPYGQALLVSALADRVGNHLAKRGDPAVLPAAAALLNSPVEKVRLAALKALGQLGGASMVPLLAQVAAGAPVAERAVAEESLSRLGGAEVDGVILAGLDKAEPRIKAELIRALGGRGIKNATPMLIKTAQEKDKQVRAESFKALAVLGEEKDLEPLTGLLVDAKSDTTREQAERALVAVCNRIANADARAKTVLAALTPQAGVALRCSLLRVLGGIGGEQALKVVRAAAGDQNDQIKDAAVRALVDWPDPGPLKDLSRIARGDPKETYRVLALRGYVRLVGLPSRRPDKETLMLYQEGMKLARRVEDKKLALAGLASIPDPLALALIEPYLKNPELQAEAVAALLAVGQGLADSHPDAAKEAAGAVLAVSKDETARKQASEISETVKKYAAK